LLKQQLTNLRKNYQNHIKDGQLRRSLYETKHFADSILRGIDGDLRVKDDKIIATLYNVPESLNLKQYYEDLPNKLEREGINPKIPWLFDFKLDFRFK